MPDRIVFNKAAENLIEIRGYFREKMRDITCWKI